MLMRCEKAKDVMASQMYLYMVSDDVFGDTNMCAPMSDGPGRKVVNIKKKRHFSYRRYCYNCAGDNVMFIQERLY